MEVSTIMSSPGQLNQGWNGAAPANEPQCSPILSGRFSSLLGLFSGMGETMHLPVDATANPIIQKVPMQQPALMQLQGMDMESEQGTEEDQGTTALPEKDEKTVDLSAGVESSESAVSPKHTGLPWAHAVEVVSSIIVAHPVNVSPKVLTLESSLPLKANGENQATVIRTQSAAPPLLDGPATAIGDAEPPGMQLDPAAKTALAGGLSSNNGGNATSVLSVFSVANPETVPTTMASSSTGRADYRRIPLGTGADPDGFAEPLSNGLARSPNVTLPQMEGDSTGSEGILLQPVQGQQAEISTLAGEDAGNPRQWPSTAETTITGETRKGSEVAANAYRTPAVEVASNAGTVASSSAAGIQAAGQAAIAKPAMTTQEQDNTEQLAKSKPEDVNLSVRMERGSVDPAVKEGSKVADRSMKTNLDIANTPARAELNGMDFSAKPGLNNADPAHGQQRFETAITEAAKSLLREAGVDTPGKPGEEKSTPVDSSGIPVHGASETRVNGENRLTTPANAGKLPFAEQIHNQVRDRLESGDYGINKGSITLKLHPEDLGELKINLRMEDNRLKVEIVTDNHSVKEALMQNMDSLKETLSRQNIAMDRFNVTADLRQGFQQGSRDGSRMMQDNRGTGTPFNAAEEGPVQGMPYSWDNDDSLVSLIL